MSLPLISIIIPTYNRAEIISECLNSVKKQTFQDWECLIVDDFSTDNTFEVISEFVLGDSRFRYLKNIRTKGAPGARNTGQYAARGQYVLFLDSDDQLQAHCLETRIKVFRKDTALDIVVGIQRRIVDGKRDNLINIPTEIHPIVRFYSLYSATDIPWVNNSCLIKKYFLLKNRIEWNETIKLFQDIQFNLAMLHCNPKIEWSLIEDSCWIYRSSIENIGKTSFSIEIARKVIEMFFANNIGRVSKELQRQIIKQRKSSIVSLSMRASLTSSKSEYRAYMEYLESLGLGNSALKKALIFRNALDCMNRIGRKRLYHKLLSKLTTMFLQKLYPSVIKESNYCILSTIPSKFGYE